MPERNPPSIPGWCESRCLAHNDGRPGTCQPGACSPTGFGEGFGVARVVLPAEIRDRSRRIISEGGQREARESSTASLLSLILAGTLRADGERQSWLLTADSCL